MSIRRPARPGIAPVLLFLAALLTSAPDAQARPSPAKPKGCLEAGSVEFGPVRIGQEGAGELPVWNNCGRDYAVSKVVSERPEFVASLPTSPRVVPANNDTYIPIFFKPADTGLVVAKVTLYTTDPHRRKIQVTVQGRGVMAPALTVEPGSLERTMDPGTTSSASLALRNTGGSRVEVTVATEAAPLPRPERGWKVLYLNTTNAGLWGDGMYRILTALGNVDTAEAWDGIRSLPSLARLLEYDIVMAAAANPWSDSVAAGDLLADYLEAGGKVVLLATTMADDPHARRLYGRIQSYFPLHSARTTFGGESGILASHPITVGVTSFYSETIMQTQTTPGAGGGIPLGTYANGYLIGAYHPTSALVGLNIDHLNLGGDAPTLVANTLDYLGTSPAWLIPTLPSGMPYLVVPPGESRSLDLALHSHRLPAGVHRLTLTLTHDAGEGPNPIEIPVTLRVTSQRRLVVDMDTLDFGITWQGGRKTLPVRLKNTGNASTLVSGFASGLPAFSLASALPLEIPAFSHVVVEAAYAPTGLGRESSSLDVHSDAGNEPVLGIVVAGTSVAPPTLVVSPDRLEGAVSAGQTVERMLTLRNDGGDPLEVSLRPVAEPGPGTPGTGPEKLKVLYLHTMGHSYENPTDFFMWNVLSLENVDSLTGFYGGDSLPSLDYLRGFDAVLVVGGAPWSDPEAAGNLLADYVDAGGKVCLMHYSLATGIGAHLAGRITTPDYAPVPGAPPAPRPDSWTNAYFESAEDHPIMRGITADLWTASTMGVSEPGPLGRPLGRFDNGTLIGAYHTRKPVVFLNIHPHDGDHGWQTIPLLGNTFAHLSDFYTWLQPATRQVTLAPGESVDVPVTLGTLQGPGPGTFAGRLELYHNAPGDALPRVVPVTLTVEGEARTAAAGSR